MVSFNLFTIIAFSCFVIQVAADAVDWASVVDSRGDGFPDFSHSGYHSSDISLPTINSPDITVRAPRKATEDMNPIIQEAIDAASVRGGGIVKLPSGRLIVTAGMQLRSNVIITGSGSSNTTLVLKRKPTKPVFFIGKPGLPPAAVFGLRSKITDTYVPIGSSVVTVIDGTKFAAGQSVYISRATTGSWVRSNGMSDLVRDGIAQTWIPINKKIKSPNEIKSINGNQITLKIPLVDALDSANMKPEVWAYTPPFLTSEMGIQNLRIEAPKTCSGTPLDEMICNYAAIRFTSWTVDSWASGLTLVGFNQFFDVQRGASRITIQDSTMNRNRDIEGEALPIDILIRGSQVLVQDCAQVGLATARSFSVATDSLTQGPNTVARHTTQSSVQTIYPHERWAQGLLVEDTSVPTFFMNRGNKGTGQGWAINAGVGWNLRGNVNFQSPPRGINWCVGCGGQNAPLGNATFIHPSEQVTPRSLFAAQLEARGVHWNLRGKDN